MCGVGTGKARLFALGACTGLTFVMTAASGRAEPTEPRGARAGAVRQIRIADNRTRDAVRRAVENARAQLSDMRCRSVLSDFADSSGRPLQGAMEDSQLAPEDYLGQLLFYDGSGLPQCRPGVAAFTIRGGRVVFICADRFVALRWPNAEVILIHEMLHSLGLGENPPTPREISDRVQAHCYAHLSQRAAPPR
jgi:hypothetical protein